MKRAETPEIQFYTFAAGTRGILPTPLSRFAVSLYLDLIAILSLLDRYPTMLWKFCSTLCVVN